MLSVLIPVYNWNVVPLVSELYRQLENETITFEIIVGDDASEERYHLLNSVLEDKAFIRYIRFSENQGRSRLRNFLADQASYPYLLYMDCDAAVISGSYIPHYVKTIREHAGEENFVIIGGTAYREGSPGSSNSLRWYYGRKREQKTSRERSKNPYRSFTPFNFVVTRSTFRTIRFDESLTTYGNEDTLYGYHLKVHRIKVLHIDNPLYHEGLDENEIYLMKIESAIDNLIRLSAGDSSESSFISDNRLLTTYRLLSKMHLAGPVKSLFGKYAPWMKRRLIKTPSLPLLDFYKLGYFLQHL